MDKRERLTDAQQGVLDYIVQYRNSKGWPPTRGEIAKHFGWDSSNAATQHLRLIEKKGYIRLVPMISRGIEVLP
jgi:repressor LexA